MCLEQRGPHHRLTESATQPSEMPAEVMPADHGSWVLVADVDRCALLEVPQADEGSEVERTPEPVAFGQQRPNLTTQLIVGFGECPTGGKRRDPLRVPDRHQPAVALAFI